MAGVELPDAHQAPMWLSTKTIVIARFCTIEELAVRLGLPLEFLWHEQHFGHLPYLDVLALSGSQPTKSWDLCEGKTPGRYYDVDACEAALVQDRSRSTKADGQRHREDILASLT